MSTRRVQSPAAPRNVLLGEPRADAVQRVKNSRMEITDEGLKAIKAWKYKGGTYTPIDSFLNKFWWTPVSGLLPDSMAPNAVTLLGLFFIIAGYVVMVMYYSGDFFTPAPQWAYLFAAFCNFMYQTLDAIDGKHARRLGASGPLGQLFDHGCDSVSLTFVCMTLAAASRMDFGVRTVLLLSSFFVPFWLAQWAEYHTHMMEHSLGGWLGITEGQLCGIIAMALPALVGPDFYLMDLGPYVVPYLEPYTGIQEITLPAWYCGGEACPLTPRDPSLWAQLAVGLMFIISNIKAVVYHCENKTEAFKQTIPVWSLMALAIAWCLTVPQARNHPRILIFSLGLAFTFLNNKMIMAGMTRMKYHSFHTILFPLPIIYVIAKMRLLPRHDDVLLGAYCAFSFYKLQKYTVNVVEEISQFLGIYVLHLGKRKDN